MATTERAVRFLGRKGPRAVSASVDLKRFDFPEPNERDIQEASIVFVAVKAFDLRTALLQHLPQIPETAPIIPVGNGDIQGELAETNAQFPHHRLRLGITTLAVTRLREDTFELKNLSAFTEWGPLFPREEGAKEVERHLCEERPADFRWVRDPLPSFRRKWLFNTTLNTFVAAHNLRRNAEVLTKERELAQVFSEAYRLGEQRWGKWPQSNVELFRILVQLARNTAHNENSMAADRRLGRRTESDYLAGLARQYEGYPLLKALHSKLAG